MQFQLLSELYGASYAVHISERDHLIERLSEPEQSILKAFNKLIKIMKCLSAFESLAKLYLAVRLIVVTVCYSKPGEEPD